MKKFFLSLAVFVMALCANAQTNQYFWYQGNLMMGNPIAQIDSVTFGDGESVDTLHILLPRTIIKVVHDTTYIIVHDTVCPNLIPEGALAGEFSVSATKKVRFSKGNLQYQASTGTWRFAENQWDYVGSVNNNISSTYTGWIDLFGWGTGNNPTNHISNNENYPSFVDWGTNPISNGGNEANIWHTLTINEWVYLLTARQNAFERFGLGCVNEINGVILLPDNWTMPNNLTFKTATMQGLSEYEDYYRLENFSYNTYSSEQWSAMEENGAIFLPAAGFRYTGNSIIFVGANGYYWSSTSVDEDYAYDCEFELSSYKCAINPQSDNDFRHYGFSVRLVQDVE